MRIIEIIAVSASITALLVTAFFTTRTALAFKRTFSSFRKKVEPKAFSLISGGEKAQSRAFDLLDNLNVLQTRVEETRISLLKMIVLVRAVRETWMKFSPLLNYVGL